MYEQSLAFSFEAAHRLSPTAAAPEYDRIHGHSFVVTMTLEGDALEDGKWLHDFGDVRRICETLKAQLDHRMLNDVEGLAVPTLENLAAWIFDAAAPHIPSLARVAVERPTLGEKVAFRR